MNDFSSGAVIGRSDYWGGASQGAALVLQGRISADTAKQWLHVRTSGAFTNDGTVEAKGGGTLDLASLQGALGAGVALGDSGTLWLRGNYAVDQPLTTGAASTLNLGGS